MYLANKYTTSICNTDPERSIGSRGMVLKVAYQVRDVSHALHTGRIAALSEEHFVVNGWHNE